MQEELLQRFQKIRAFQANGERAPHKPLLILYSIAQLEAGKDELDFEASLDSLKEFFELFGPPREPSPEHPFTRLSNDSDGRLWRVVDRASGPAGPDALRRGPVVQRNRP